MYVNVRMQLKMPLMDADKIRRMYEMFADELELLGYATIREHGIDSENNHVEILVESGKTSWKFQPKAKKKSRKNVALEQQAA